MSRKGREYSENFQINPFYNIRVRRAIHFMREAFGSDSVKDKFCIDTNTTDVKQVTLRFPEEDYCIMKFLKQTGEVEVENYDKDGHYLGANDGKLDKKIIKTIEDYTKKAKDERELRP